MSELVGFRLFVGYQHTQDKCQCYLDVLANGKQFSATVEGDIYRPVRGEKIGEMRGLLVPAGKEGSSVLVNRAELTRALRGLAEALEEKPQ